MNPKVKILGISGTPIKGGNCDKLVQEALKAAAELEGVETEFVTLADKEIAPCRHCQYCMENRTRCKYADGDDAYKILDMMVEADGLILGGPTWNRTVAPPLLNLFSRTRYFIFFSQELRNKVGGFITLGWFGHGMDRAIDAMRNTVYSNGIIPVAEGAAIVSALALGKQPDYMEHGVLDDPHGVRVVRGVGKRVVEVARMIKYAREAGIVMLEAPNLATGGTIRPKYR